MGCKLGPAARGWFTIHLPGKQGLAYWQVSRRKFADAWQPAQFSMRLWSRRMSACWLAMSCWSFLTNAIKSLMPRSKFSVTSKSTLQMTKLKWLIDGSLTIAVAVDDWNVAPSGSGVAIELGGALVGAVVRVQVALAILVSAWLINGNKSESASQIWNVIKCSMQI